MKLLLTSGGFTNEIIRNVFLKMLDKDPKNSSVAFIPTAADPEEDKWFVQSAIDEIKELEMNLVSIDLKEENEESLRNKLSGCDVIYVNGGNTFYLLDWVRKSGFDKIVKDLVSHGKVYVGTSAGSIIVGPDIGIAEWSLTGDKNIVGLNDLTGLNLVPLVISPHFVEEERRILEEKGKDFSHRIVALTNNQAILVEDDKIEIVGSDERIILNI